MKKGKWRGYHIVYVIQGLLFERNICIKIAKIKTWEIECSLPTGLYGKE